MDLKPFAVKVWTGYDECRVFPSLEAYISFCKEKNWAATSAILGVIEVFSDLSEKEVSEKDFLRRNLIKKTVFDEETLQMEAKIKEKESKINYDQFLTSFRGMAAVTGSCFMPIKAEEYISEYKKANKYQWT